MQSRRARAHTAEVAGPQTIGPEARATVLRQETGARDWLAKFPAWWDEGRLRRRQFVITTFLALGIGSAILATLWATSYDGKGWGTEPNYILAVVSPTLGEPAGIAMLVAVLSYVRKKRE